MGVFFGLDALTVAPGTDRARLLAGGSYHLTNRVDHKPRILSLEEVAAVRVCDVFGVEKVLPLGYSIRQKVNG
jgi:hypothetical protein